MVHPERFLMAGVMGWPVMHSRSPKLHNYWLHRHGLEGVYVPLAVPIDRLGVALRALPALGFSGCNLTIPHKIEALSLLDHVDPLARRIGAANCVVVRPDGSLAGLNTDSWGFAQSVAENIPDWRAGAGPAVVVGAGGGARAVVVGLIDRGAREIRVVNRSRERAEALRELAGGAITVVDWAERHDSLGGAATLVNTTSQGMVGQPALDLSLAALPPEALVCDIVYTPVDTPLLAAARRRGNRTVDGLGMLLHQARPSFEAWFGILPDVTTELRRSIEATL